MSNPRISIVLTTINDGSVLDGYCQQAEREGVKDQVRIIVIPDLKTPSKLFNKILTLLDKGFNIKCPTVDDQSEYLMRFGAFSELVPWNSDNRRNIGYLMALASGDDIMLSIDDDNYCFTDWSFDRIKSIFFGCEKLPVAASEAGWFNILKLLQTTGQDGLVYPRGFPHHKRHSFESVTFSKAQECGNIAMNAGLWFGDPDLDAMTWLVDPCKFNWMTRTSCLLGDTWSPINTQNTSLRREVIPAYYYPRMNYPMAGFPIDRYGDIFSGYFAQACVRHMGGSIRVGTPIAEHRRNSHNYLHDLTSEIGAMLANESLTEWLPGLKLEGSTYSETYLCLADAIDHQVWKFKGQIWTDSTRAYFHQMTYCMRQWVKACAIAGGVK